MHSISARKTTIEGRVDMDALAALDARDAMVLPAEATHALLGARVFVTPEMFVARMTADRIMVMTESRVFVAVDDLEIDDGIDALQDIAGLDCITRAVSGDHRMVFTRDTPES
jgi:hypothetical protein